MVQYPSFALRKSIGGRRFSNAVPLIFLARSCFRIINVLAATAPGILVLLVVNVSLLGDSAGSIDCLDTIKALLFNAANVDFFLLLLADAVTCTDRGDFFLDFASEALVSPNEK
jgi:hypothetical protein